MDYRCKRCPPTGEWHFEHADDPDNMIPVATRDDLIRLVVGMQWATAMALLDPYSAFFREAFMPDMSPQFRVAGLPTASTIVDEWLGVRS